MTEAHRPSAQHAQTPSEDAPTMPPLPQLRPHQRETVDAVLRALEMPAHSTVPGKGLRTQVIMATGAGKTLVAARSAEELSAGRVLVLVPSLGLLAQTEAA